MLALCTVETMTGSWFTVGAPTGTVTSPLVLPPRPSVTVTAIVQLDVLGWPDRRKDGEALASLKVPAHVLVHAYVSASPSLSLAATAKTVAWLSTTQAGVAAIWSTVGHVLIWTLTVA